MVMGSGAGLPVLQACCPLFRYFCNESKKHIRLRGLLRGYGLILVTIIEQTLSAVSCYHCCLCPVPQHYMNSSFSMELYQGH